MSTPGPATRPGLRPMTRVDASGDALAVAPRLLGAHVSCRGVTVRLTEVEAYRGSEDPGSHAFRGMTPRTRPMFLEGGHVYVYFSYGMHVCANLVTGPEGTASAVLLRAGEVVRGAEAARGRSGTPRHPLPEHRLASGPARLARVLGLTLADSGVDALGAGSPLAVQLSAAPVADARTGPRVGVSGEGGDASRFPWRFWLDGEVSVSPYRAVRPRRRGPGRAGPPSAG